MKQKKIINAPLHFNLECWDNVEFVWNRKPFLRTSVSEVMHVPIIHNMDSVNKELLHKAIMYDVLPAENETLLLRHPISPWNEEVLLSVTKPLKNDPSYTEISGTFRSMIYEGAPNMLRNFFKQTSEYLEAKNEIALTFYIQKVAEEVLSNGKEHNTYLIIAQVANKQIKEEPHDIDFGPNNILLDS